MISSPALKERKTQSVAANQMRKPIHEFRFLYSPKHFQVLLVGFAALLYS
jgi:hypothetical protein